MNGEIKVGAMIAVATALGSIEVRVMAIRQRRGYIELVVNMGGTKPQLAYAHLTPTSEQG